mmetsp:Transcript_8589/g.8715  ORF Transcript_8589/g.8715 Transcript_8589/m.8715 type:complete len:265 (+) Transcript_8589:114-908(+)
MAEFTETKVVPEYKSELEAKHVQALKLRIEDFMRNDTVLATTISETKYLRFLRGRNNDPEEAFQSLVKHLEWRHRHNAGNITDESCGVQLSNGTVYNQGYCRLGRPTLTVFADRHDSTNRNVDEIYNLIVHTVEKLISKSKPYEEKFTLIFEMSKFTLKNMDFEVVKTLTAILQLQYPETLGVSLVLTAPWIFSACWAIIKPILDPDTAAKVEFINFQKLLEYVDISQLAPELKLRYNNDVTYRESDVSNVSNDVTGENKSVTT